MNQYTKIQGIHYPKTTKEGLASYLVETARGISKFKREPKLPMEMVEKYNLMLSQSVAEEIQSSKGHLVFYKNTEIDIPDLVLEQSQGTKGHSCDLKIESKNILIFEKQNQEFIKLSRIDSSLIKRITHWEKAVVGNKKHLMLGFNESQYVKLVDLRFKNPVVLLDFVLDNCVLVK